MTDETIIIIMIATFAITIAILVIGVRMILCKRPPDHYD